MTDAPVPRCEPPAELRIPGIGRDAENDDALVLYCSRKPSSDEMRAIHDLLRIRPAELKALVRAARRGLDVITHPVERFGDDFRAAASDLAAAVAPFAHIPGDTE